MTAVGERTCAELRRAAAGSRSLESLAAEYRLDPGVVAEHLWDRCDHDVDEPPVPIE